MSKNCIICGSIFNKRLKEGIRDWSIRKFCSQTCYRVFKNSLPNRGGTIQKGAIPWNAGKKGTYSMNHSGQFKKGMAPWNKGIKTGLVPKTAFKENQMTNEQHPLWKGNDVSYSGLHYWVARKLGKPDSCEFCGKSGLKGRHIQWANKSGKYLRDLSDWLRLCYWCHKKYDNPSKATRT